MNKTSFPTSLITRTIQQQLPVGLKTFHKYEIVARCHGIRWMSSNVYGYTQRRAQSVTSPLNLILLLGSSGKQDILKLPALLSCKYVLHIDNFNSKHFVIKASVSASFYKKRKQLKNGSRNKGQWEMFAKYNENNTEAENEADILKVRIVHSIQLKSIFAHFIVWTSANILVNQSQCASETFHIRT